MEVLSLVSGIVQINDLSVKILRDINRVTDKNEEIRESFALVDELIHSLDHLREAKVATESDLAALRTQADGFATELVEITELLIKSRHAPPWKWPVQGVRAARSKRQIRIKIQRLIELHENILRTISARQNRVREDDVQKIQNSPEFRELDVYGKAAVNALLGQYLANDDNEKAARCFTSVGQLMSNFRRSTGAENVQDGDPVSNQVHTFEDERIISTEGALLELLQYRVMGNRKAVITGAFASSCQWIFDEPEDGKWTNLPEWLAHGSGLYSIVGNEASGKSTMLKYILTHEKTVAYLRRWAGTNSLVTAAFFFWRNGTQLEKSEEGLWRSLLYSALDQQRQLMPIVFPKEWAVLYSSTYDEERLSNPGLGAWQIGELRQAFRRLVTQDQVPLKLFILIDGIDEYQDKGCGEDFTTIVRFITASISSSTNAKALISSRPLEVFHQLNIQPSLTLHELNHSDIERYVRDVLGQDNLFRANCATDNEQAEKVIRYILDESKGVFLWAVLSTRTVKSKLQGGMTVEEINLDLPGELAPALGDLYQSIWNGMDSVAKTQASQILQIMLAGKEIKRSWMDNDEEGLRLIDLALGLSDPCETIRASITPWNLAQPAVQDKCDSIATGFMKTWPGFVTIASLCESERKWNPSLRIRYCHRSVPEFFSEHYTSVLIDATRELPFQFCPRMAHLKTIVHQLKVLPKRLPNEPLRVLWALVTTALLAANRIDGGEPFHPGDSDDVVDSHVFDANAYHGLLAELDRTMQHHHKMLQQDNDNNYIPTVLKDHRGTVAVHDRGRDSRLKAAMHWSNFHSEPEYVHRRNWNDSFLSLAVQFGLRNYVECQLGSGNSSKVLKAKKGRPLLDYALQPLLPPVVAPETLITPGVVGMLLAHGASPNDRFEGRTCWEGALHWQYNSFAKGERRIAFERGGTTEDMRRVAEARAKISSMLLDTGADVRASVTTFRGSKVSARQVLEASLKGWAKDETVELLLGRFPK